ncbi:hypothetical protein [Streptomyces sp. NPDC047525]|uniref:ATP-dependent DNA ligase n=1 Tax=Streptomyces sp. NPDC047525 TaxID=3155264 RepID=UPI0033C6F818
MAPAPPRWHGETRSGTSSNGDPASGFAVLVLRESANPRASVWDCLMADGMDPRGRPYTERRAGLLDVLADVPPPIQPTPATDDPEVALAWYTHLPAQGIEGVVAKRASTVYRAARIWKKIRNRNCRPWSSPTCSPAAPRQPNAESPSPAGIGPNTWQRDGPPRRFRQLSRAVFRVRAIGGW